MATAPAPAATPYVPLFTQYRTLSDNVERNNTPGGPGRAVGVSAYQVTDTTVGGHNTYPAKGLETLIFDSADVFTGPGILAMPSNILNSVSDAHDDDYLLLFRYHWGVDSPIRSPSNKAVAGWMASEVQYIRTLQNEQNPDTAYDQEVLIPLPWDVQNRVRHREFLALLNTWLNTSCPRTTAVGPVPAGAHPRWLHVFGMPAAYPTESGTEMSIGHGQLATQYLGSGTLSGGLAATSSGTVSITVTGAGSWPTIGAANPANLGGGTIQGFTIVIEGGADTLRGGANEEHIYITGHAAGSTTLTFPAANRGWPGSKGNVARAHATGVAVKYIDTDDGYSTGTGLQVSGNSGRNNDPLTFNGKTGVFAHDRVNWERWEAAPGKGAQTTNEANRRTWFGDSWIDNIRDAVELLPNIRVLLAGSGIFSDGQVQANRVLDTIKNDGIGTKLCCMTTNLRTRDGALTYQAADNVSHLWMLKAKANGHLTGFQTAGLGGTNGMANDRMDLVVRAVEDAIIKYDICFYETQMNRLSTKPTTYGGPTSTSPDPTHTIPAVGGWPGEASTGPVTYEQYLLTHAQNVQDRLQPLPGSGDVDPFLTQWTSWYDIGHVESSTEFWLGNATLPGSPAGTLAAKLVAKDAKNRVSQYINGSYVPQQFADVAVDVETSYPLSILSFWPGNYLPASGSDASTEGRLSTALLAATAGSADTVVVSRVGDANVPSAVLGTSANLIRRSWPYGRKVTGPAVVLSAAVSAGATSIAVNVIPAGQTAAGVAYSLASGTKLEFANDVVLTTSGSVVKGALTIPVTAAPSTIPISTVGAVRIAGNTTFDAHSHTTFTGDWVDFIRIEDELLQVRAEPTESGGSISIPVYRGLWGTKPVAHGTNSRVLAPVYIVAASEPNRQGHPSKFDVANPLRYALNQRYKEGNDFIGDRIVALAIAAQGYDTVHLDHTMATITQQADSNGVLVYGWNDKDTTKLTQAAYGQWQTKKLAALRARFPTLKFHVRDIGSLDTTTEEGKANFGILAVSHGGYADSFGIENPATAFDFDRYAETARQATLNNLPVFFWIRWNLLSGISSPMSSDQYKRFAYGTLLLFHHKRVTPKWKVGGPWENSAPDPLFLMDLGSPVHLPTSLAAMVDASQTSFYIRHYSKGTVLVNASTSSRTYVTPTTNTWYTVDVDGTVTQLAQGATISVPSHDAAFVFVASDETRLVEG